MLPVAMPQEKLALSLPELNRRWNLARQAAIKVSGQKQVDEDTFFTQIMNYSENEFEAILKKVFLNSRTLGCGYQKHHGIFWEVDDFLHHLPELGVACLQGRLEKKLNGSGAITLTRTGCAFGVLGGFRVCQYWHEAFDGLVTGLSEDVRMTRHACTCIGDENCLDVIYRDEANFTSNVLENNVNKWGEIPSAMLPTLNTICERFVRMGVKLTFHGLSQKKLFYKFALSSRNSCSKSVDIYSSYLEVIIKEKFADLSLSEVASRSVMEENYG